MQSTLGFACALASVKLIEWSQLAVFVSREAFSPEHSASFIKLIEWTQLAGYVRLGGREKLFPQNTRPASLSLSSGHSLLGMYREKLFPQNTRLASLSLSSGHSLLGMSA